MHIAALLLALHATADTPAAAAPAGPAPAAPAAGALSAQTPCVTALPRLASIARGTVSSTCGSTGTVVHEGDVVALSPRGHVRLETSVDGERDLTVTCVSAAPLAVTVAGNEAPWLTAPEVACGPWAQNERVCKGPAGDEVLVCNANAAAAKKRARVQQPLGLPTWYVGEVVAGPPPQKKLTRVVVQDVLVDGEAGDRLAPIFTSALVGELRKLQGVSVVGLDEVRALIAHAADRQTMGCDEAGCLAELADALGADVVITARLAAIGESHAIAFRRLDAMTAKVDGVDRRFEAGNNEEFLTAVGPAVAELFPDVPLVPGAERGADKELGRRLNPPPLPPWAFFATAGVGAGVLAVGVASGVTSSVLAASVQQRVDASVQVETAGRPLKEDFDTALGAAYAADALFVVGAACVVAAGGMALFTDFWGYGEEL